MRECLQCGWAHCLREDCSAPGCKRKRPLSTEYRFACSAFDFWVCPQGTRIGFKWATCEEGTHMFSACCRLSRWTAWPREQLERQLVHRPAGGERQAMGSRRREAHQSERRRRERTFAASLLGCACFFPKYDFRSRFLPVSDMLAPSAGRSVERCHGSLRSRSRQTYRPAQVVVISSRYSNSRNGGCGANDRGAGFWAHQNQ